MKHDFTKPAYVMSAKDQHHKQRVPVYILFLIGLFLLALLTFFISNWAR